MSERNEREMLDTMRDEDRADYLTEKRQKEQAVDALCAPVGKVSEGRKVMCCYIDQETGEECPNRAEWEITSGPGLDDYTHSCTCHVGHLLTNAPEHSIRQLGEGERK